MTTGVERNPWPVSARRNAEGVLEIGGVDLRWLAARYGTPLYVYDEGAIRASARAFRDGLAAHYPTSQVVYAAKAFLTTALVGILAEEGLGMDVVSGGELYTAIRGGMPAGSISFHGNNKSRRELSDAIAAGIGKIVIDNDHEISLLEELTKDLPEPVTVMMRINPGVDVHTHRKISTGVADSKFGFPIGDGQAARAVQRILEIPGLRLVGLHAHVGSQLFDTSSIVDGIDALLELAADMRNEEGFELSHLSPGGGFGIAYIEGDEPLSPQSWMQTIAMAVRAGCEERKLPEPTLTIEPGRAIVGSAGVALYEAGARKHLSGIRTYLSLDGGMADNIRPALYDARYTATVANREPSGPEAPLTIAGKYCESGDILIEDVTLPAVEAGDLIAVPAAGAYTLAMASNYNQALRPAVVFVDGGRARVVRRRETYDDLLRCEV